MPKLNDLMSHYIALHSEELGANAVKAYNKFISLDWEKCLDYFLVNTGNEKMELLHRFGRLYALAKLNDKTTVEERLSLTEHIYDLTKYIEVYKNTAWSKFPRYVLRFMHQYRAYHFYHTQEYKKALEEINYALSYDFDVNKEDELQINIVKVYILHQLKNHQEKAFSMTFQLLQTYANYQPLELIYASDEYKNWSKNRLNIKCPFTFDEVKTQLNQEQEDAIYNCILLFEQAHYKTLENKKDAASWELLGDILNWVDEHEERYITIRTLRGAVDVKEEDKNFNPAEFWIKAYNELKDILIKKKIANYYFDKGDYPNAKTSFQDVAKESPNDYETHLKLAYSCFNIMDEYIEKEAIEHTDEYAKLCLHHINKAVEIDVKRATDDELHIDLRVQVEQVIRDGLGMEERSIKYWKKKPTKAQIRRFVKGFFEQLQQGKIDEARYSVAHQFNDWATQILRLWSDTYIIYRENKKESIPEDALQNMVWLTNTTWLNDLSIDDNLHWIHEQSFYVNIKYANEYADLSAQFCINNNLKQGWYLTLETLCKR